MILSTAHLTGLLLLVGGLLYRQFIWNGVAANASQALTRSVMRRTTVLMISGALLLIATGLSEVLLVGNLLQTNGTPEGFNGLELGSRDMRLVQVGMAVLFVAGILGSERLDSILLRSSILACGLAIISTSIVTSQVGAASGVLANASGILHWIAVTAWGGTLLCLSLQPWSVFYREFEGAALNIVPMVDRYTKLSSIAFGLFSVSGMILAFVHVHNVDAMNTTNYGAALKLKVAVVALMLITLSVNLLKTAPAFRANQENPVILSSLLQRFRKIVTAETVLLVILVVTSSILAVQNAPGVAPFLRPQSWQMIAGEVPLNVQLQPVAGSSTQVRFEISAASANYQFPDGTQAEFGLSTLQGDVNIRNSEALPIGPSGFLGEAVLAVPGEWLFDLRLNYPNQAAQIGNYQLSVPAQPLAQDLRAYLTLSRIVAPSLPNKLQFVVGALLILSAAWLMRLCYRGVAPHWIMPVSMVNLALGGYLAVSVLFVRTYPSTFWDNPQPYTADVIRHGEAIYAEHCARCHGVSGQGDGPWAKAERGSIPDLSAPHIDAHSDGEIFWWITYGIPSLGMPALGEKIEIGDRWAVINSVRSLRHGIPLPQASGGTTPSGVKKPMVIQSSL